MYSIFSAEVASSHGSPHRDEKGAKGAFGAFVHRCSEMDVQGRACAEDIQKGRRRNDAFGVVPASFLLLSQEVASWHGHP